MARRALLVGIDHYEHLSTLSGCVADARAMRDILAINDDGSPNYDCRLLDSDEGPPITKKILRSKWLELFDGFGGDVLFYFSGHGTPLRMGGFLVTQEGDDEDPGLHMDELLTLANGSKAKSILLILDCCHSGHLGNPAILQAGGSVQDQAQLREGLTILAASRPTEAALETEGHGVFTALVLGALRGGASDVRGRVSAASIYAYVEQALGSWDQRPLYKSHADHLPPVRRCTPSVPDSLLRELSTIFPEADSAVRMDPSFEFTHPAADMENVELFKKFKILRNARLLTTEGEKDLYFVALESECVGLTPLGQFYWRLAKLNRIRS